MFDNIHQKTPPHNAHALKDIHASIFLYFEPNNVDVTYRAVKNTAVPGSKNNNTIMLNMYRYRNRQRFDTQMQ